MSTPARILLTPGEPAGIGPDLAVRVAQEPSQAELVVVGDPQTLEARAREIGLPLQLEPLRPGEPPAPNPAGTLKLLAVPVKRPVTCGQLDSANAPYVLETLQLAVQQCMDGTADALVTGPVHKGAINDAGISFMGHTEYLAQLCGVPDVVMMLTTPGLRVALATTHIPLRRVSDAITGRGLEVKLRILDAELQTRMGVPHPRIVVCGLNPHAGEGGYLGREEVEVITPVLGSLRREGFNIDGPVPADTAFVPDRLAETDAVFCMYHDQGLPVLKHMGFGRAVNVTLGLPVIRTSVDHGTALERAGGEEVDTGSLAAAIDLAREMAMQMGRLRAPQR